MASRLRSPPEMPPGSAARPMRVPAQPRRSSSSSTRSTRARLASADMEPGSRSRAVKASVSRTVRYSKKGTSWVT